MKDRGKYNILLLLILSLAIVPETISRKTNIKESQSSHRVQNNRAQFAKISIRQSKPTPKFSHRKLTQAKRTHRSLLKNQLIQIERDLTRQIKAHKRNEANARKLNPFGKATITPLVINAPKAKPEQKEAPKKTQNPVYFIPQIMLPKRRKRLVVHHPASMEAYTQQMVRNQAPPYLNWMLNNKHYEEWMATNPYAQSLMEDSALMKDIGKAVPSKSPGGFV